MKIVIETARLLLREFIQEDAENLLALNADPEVLKYTGDKPFASRIDARNFVRQYNHYTQYGYGRWAMILKDSNLFIGWCGLRYNDDIREVDLGFRTLQKYWSQGYTTEAASACVTYAFNSLGLKKLIGRARAENTASIHILKKLGMKFEKDFLIKGNRWMYYTLNSA